MDGDQAALIGPLAYGHFSAMLVEDGRVRGLQRHLDRLVRDCALVFGAGLDVDEVRHALRRTAAPATGSQMLPATGSQMLRATVFDPDFHVARPGPGPDGATPRVVVTTRALTPRPATGLRLRSVEYVRDWPEVKHLGLFGQLHQRRLAQEAGYDDALFVGPGGRIAEGPTWNLALLVDEGLVWPDGLCLPGVTRELVHEVARASGVPSVFRAAGFEPGRVRAAFATSAGVGVVPVTSIDGTVLPGDPALLEAFQKGYAELDGEEL